MRKPTILTLVAHYLPGYKSGGPVRTIANMVDHLGEEFDFRIITQDRDLGDSRPYPDVRVDDWNSVGRSWVFYCSPKSVTLAALRHLISQTPHDVLYLNSFFSAGFTIKPLLLRRFGLLPRRPVLLAPRGEFSEGAFRLKRWKKAPFVRLAKVLGLYNGLVWQASSAHEAEDIERVFGKQEYIIAADMPPVIPIAREGEGNSRRQDGPLRVIFLSRISPKKNLDFALRVLTKVRVPVEFNIYGPIDDQAYWEQCQSLIEKLPSGVKAFYHGPIEHSEVPRVMAENDLFFLPTHGENYGHVIPEALSAGTPVLISNTTPWRNLSEAQVGWDLPLDSPDAYLQRIEECAAMNLDSYKSFRERAQAYARERLKDPQIIEANRSMLLGFVQNQ